MLLFKQVWTLELAAKFRPLMTWKDPLLSSKQIIKKDGETMCMIITGGGFCISLDIECIIYEIGSRH